MLSSLFFKYFNRFREELRFGYSSVFPPFHWLYYIILAFITYSPNTKIGEQRKSFICPSYVNGHLNVTILKGKKERDQDIKKKKKKKTFLISVYIFTELIIFIFSKNIFLIFLTIIIVCTPLPPWSTVNLVLKQNKKLCIVLETSREKSYTF